MIMARHPRAPEHTWDCCDVSRLSHAYEALTEPQAPPPSSRRRALNSRSSCRRQAPGSGTGGGAVAGADDSEGEVAGSTSPPGGGTSCTVEALVTHLSRLSREEPGRRHRVPRRAILEHETGGSRREGAPGRDWARGREWDEGLEARRRRIIEELFPNRLAPPTQPEMGTQVRGAWRPRPTRRWALRCVVEGRGWRWGFRTSGVDR